MNNSERMHAFVRIRLYGCVL